MQHALVDEWQGKLNVVILPQCHVFICHYKYYVLEVELSQHGGRCENYYPIQPIWNQYGYVTMEVFWCYWLGNYKTWSLYWTGLWTGLNYGLTRKMLKLFSMAFYSVFKRYQVYVAILIHKMPCWWPGLRNGKACMWKLSLVVEVS